MVSVFGDLHCSRNFLYTFVTLNTMLQITKKVSTKQKAMITVYHRFLCTQSHLYIHHCIVKCTVCLLLLFTVLKTIAFSTSHFTYLLSRPPVELV